MDYRYSTSFLSLAASLWLITVGLFPLSTQAQDITVTVPEVEPNVGETVTLSVEADFGNKEVKSYSNLRFTFDDSVINIVNVRDGSELSFGSSNLTGNQREDTLSVSNIAGDPPVTGSGEFLRIDVELVADGGTPFDLTPSVTRVGEPSISVFGEYEGSGEPLEISSIDQGRVGELAQAQIIHNAADPSVGTVDVYLDGALAFDNLSFREATPFMERLASGVEFEVGVAPSTSNGPEDVIYSQTATLSPGEAYTFVANGVLSPDEFASNPDGEPIDFQFFAQPGAKSTASEGDVDLRAVHGATDAPTVDIDENGTTLLDDLTYGDVSAEYLSATPETKRLVVTAGDSEQVVASFDADLSGLGGSAATVLASGFLDPSANQDGAPLRLLAVQPNGNVATFAPADVIPIQQARQQGPDATVTIEGTVTRAFGSYVRLQDASGPTGASGLVVRQTTDDDLAQGFRDDISNGNITPGTRLQLTGTLGDYAGQLQISDEDLSSYTVQGQGESPVPQEVAFSDLQAPDGENFEGELIRVENVSFVNPDATGGVLEANTNYKVQDGNGTTFDYYVPGSDQTDVIGGEIPQDPFTYEGVLGQYNDFSGNDEGYQLIPVRVSTSLPVEMAGFDAVPSEAGAELRWSTTSETNNAGFRVEHNPAGQEGWQELAFVESKAVEGTSTEGHSYRFEVEKELDPGTHRFRLRQVDVDGTTSLAGSTELKAQMNEALILEPPAPNPVSEKTTVSFSVKETADAQVVLYNVLGQRVKTLYQGTPQAERTEELTIETGSLPSGVYMLQLRAQGQTTSQRLTVVQ